MWMGLSNRPDLLHSVTEKFCLAQGKYLIGFAFHPGFLCCSFLWGSEGPKRHPPLLWRLLVRTTCDGAAPGVTAMRSSLLMAV